MQFKGKITALEPIEQGVGKASGKPWRKQVFAVTSEEGRFPQVVAFEVWGDLIDRLPTTLGEYVEVDYDLTSRNHKGRWYHEVRAWRVGTPYAAALSPEDQRANVAAQEAARTAAPQPAPGDDLPF